VNKCVKNFMWNVKKFKNKRIKYKNVLQINYEIKKTVKYEKDCASYVKKICEFRHTLWVSGLTQDVPSPG
jgi:hypothetical protein